jgi:PucR family transcriptional regulator, purine catabolism regulatory protein
MLPTIRRILDLESVLRGLPAVLAGAENLDREVRWVHVAGRPRCAEIVLATDLPPDSGRWLAELAESGVAGVIVQAADPLPEETVRAAQRWGLPLVQVRCEIHVPEVTEAVQELLAAGQFAESRRCEEIHQRFTELSLAGASAATVVSHAAALAKCPVILENAAHQVLAFEPAGADPGVLTGWASVSRRIVSSGRTQCDEQTGWLVTPVSAQGREWGRLLVRCPRPVAGHVILAERAAGVIALDWLAHGDEDPRLRTQRTLLTSLLAGDLVAAEFAARCRALGMPLDRPVLVAVVVRHPPGRDLLDRIGNDRVALCAAIDDVSDGVLLALRSDDDVHAQLTRFAKSMGERAIVAASEPVTSVNDLRKALVEARRLAAAAGGGRWDVPYVTHRDLGLRGLMYLLRDDHRVQAYVERELGPLLKQEHANLIITLRAYLDSGGNKTDAAVATYLSRQALYDRLKRISQLLDVDLDSPRTRTALHAALTAHDAITHS